MIKQDQTANYNCFTTCLASIVDIPNTEVPTIISTSQYHIKDFCEKAISFLNEHDYGLKHHYPDNLPINEEYWVADVPIYYPGININWRRGRLHCIVMNKEKFYWDVSPNYKRKRKPQKFIRGWSITEKDEGITVEEMVNHVQDSFVAAGGYEWVVR